jgi:hypothetical protein
MNGMPNSQNNSQIKLNGLVGNFKSINSRLKLKYLSTKANSNDDRVLLEALKPMRETVSPKDLLDIDSILQRDLDDMRISQEILPYLLNELHGVVNVNHLPFFPSILAVIMPKGYITDPGIEYPENRLEEEEYFDRSSYLNYWSINEYFNSGNNRVKNNIAQMELDLSRVDVLVLDGQHRANAFRAITGVFPGTGSVYSSFYSNWDTKLPNANFDSDLPITLVWFESEDPNHRINAKEIIRDLFVSVNQNSKEISISRNILLDDKNPNSFLTRVFYTFLLNNYKFEINQLSLFHFGLDYDEGLSDRKPLGSFDLFVPETISFAFDFFFFSNSRYSLGDTRKNKSVDFNVSFAPFSDYFETSGDDYFETYVDIYDERQKKIKSIIDKREFSKNLCLSDEFNRIYKILDSFPFVGFYVSKLNDLNDSYNSKQKPFDLPQPRVAFDEIIKGEQGLYFSMRRANKTVQQNPFWSYIEDIEKSFNGRLSELFSINVPPTLDHLNLPPHVSVFDAIIKMQTKVFPIALLTACEYYNKEKSINLNNPDEFLLRVNMLGLEKWTKCFVIFWREFIKGDLTPMAWPTVTTLILRVIQDNSKNELFCNEITKSPEYVMLVRQLKLAVENYRETSLKGVNWTFLNISAFDPKTINELFKSEFEKLSDLFKLCGMEILLFDFEKVGWEYIESKFL